MLPPRTLLELTTPVDRPPVLLHLLPSPSCSKECVSPILTKQMTDSFSLPIIHLHQDVWRAKQDIVCNRLLMRLGRTNSRIFARKTTVKRINGDVARCFLQEHHLWSATKAKHNYGLFDSVTNELVAVATFSKVERYSEVVIHMNHMNYYDSVPSKMGLSWVVLQNLSRRLFANKSQTTL